MTDVAWCPPMAGTIERAVVFSERRLWGRGRLGRALGDVVAVIDMRGREASDVFDAIASEPAIAELPVRTSLRIDIT